MKNPTFSFTSAFSICLLIMMSNQVMAQQSFYKRGRATVKDVRIITLEGMNPHYQFAVVNKGVTSYWGPEEVSSYRKFYGNTYISREIEPGHFAFLELVEEGNLNLYFMKDRQLNPRFFLERSDGVFIEMTNEPRKPSYYQKVLKNEWVNCPQLNRYIKEITYTKAAMTRIVKSHNTCKRLLNPSVRHSVFGGVGYTSYHVANSRNVQSAAPVGALRRGNYPSKPSYFIGYQLEVPVLSTNTSVVTGLRLHKLDVNYFNAFGFGEVSFVIDANTLDLGIPLGIMHNVVIRNMKTFISFEIIPSYHLIDDALVTYTILEPDGQLKISTSDFTTAKFAIASNLAVGAKIPMGENHELSIKLAYDVRLGVGNSRLYNLTSPAILVYYSL